MARKTNYADGPVPGEKYYPEKSHATLTSGDAIRIFRELQGLTQTELAKRVGMTQPALSALEHDRQTLGLDRARRLAKALKVPPAVLAFPEYRAPRRRAS